MPLVGAKPRWLRPPESRLFNCAHWCLGPLALPPYGEVRVSASPGCGDVHPERRFPTRKLQAQANADVDDGGSSRGRYDLRGIDEGGRPQPGWSERADGRLRLHACAQELTPKRGTFDHTIADERVSSQKQCTTRACAGARPECQRGAPAREVVGSVDASSETLKGLPLVGAKPILAPCRRSAARRRRPGTNGPAGGRRVEWGGPASPPARGTPAHRDMIPKQSLLDASR
jgi:hypothetical protein